MAKPELKLFELVLQKEKLLPEETLFIDDSELNLEAASKLGINTRFVERNSSWDVLAYEPNLL